MENVSSVRATCWALTAYNQDKELLDRIRQGKESLPHWANELYGGLEVCPSTGREHFQGALTTDQVRCSKLLKWLSGNTHVRPARKEEALKQYVLKVETSSGDKSIVRNVNRLGLSQYIEILMRIRREQTKEMPEGSYVEYTDVSNAFIRRYGTRYLSLMVDSSTIRAYKLYSKSIFCMILDGSIDTNGSDEWKWEV